MHKLQGGIILLGLLLAGAGLLAVGSLAGSAAQTDSRFFPETGHTVAGRFLRYWDNHGGLAQQGYPLSEEFTEISTIDGKSYLVQYFERAVFEYHPEYAGTPAEVLLSLIGVDAYRQRYPQGAPDQRANFDPGTLFFPKRAASWAAASVALQNSVEFAVRPSIADQLLHRPRVVR